MGLSDGKELTYLRKAAKSWVTLGSQPENGNLSNVPEGVIDTSGRHKCLKLEKDQTESRM